MKKVSTKRTVQNRNSALSQPDLGPVERIPIDLLKPYPGNARTHDDKQIALIARSLQTFGWMNPIIAQHDGTIIAGHGRWLSAKLLGLAECPVVRIEHLSDDEMRAH